MKAHPKPYTAKVNPPAADWNNALTRRRFLVGTGKAGAVTILALHGLQIEVMAETISGSADL